MGTLFWVILVVGLIIAFYGAKNNAYTKGYIQGKKDMLSYLKKENENVR